MHDEYYGAVPRRSTLALDGYAIRLCMLTRGDSFRVDNVQAPRASLEGGCNSKTTILEILWHLLLASRAGLDLALP